MRLFSYPNPVPMSSERKLVRNSVYNTSLEKSPFLPTLAVRMLYVFLLVTPRGCLNFQSLIINREFNKKKIIRENPKCLKNVINNTFSRILLSSSFSQASIRCNKIYDWIIKCWVFWDRNRKSYLDILLWWCLVRAGTPFVNPVGIFVHQFSILKKKIRSKRSWIHFFFSFNWKFIIWYLIWKWNLENKKTTCFLSPQRETFDEIITVSITTQLRSEKNVESQQVRRI